MLIQGQGLLMTEPQAIYLLHQIRLITWRECQLWLSGQQLPYPRQNLAELVFLLQLRGPTDSAH